MKYKIINALKSTAVLILSMVVAFGITTALNSGFVKHDSMVQPEIEIGGMKIEDTTSIAPGDTIDLSPYATNTCNADIYVSVSICQELVQDPKFKDTPAAEPYMVSDTNSAPVYTYILNDGWCLVDETIDGAYIITTYVYTAVLKSGEATLPVFDNATMQDFTTPCYGTAVHDINMSADFMAVPADGNTSLTAPEIWELIKNYTTLE